MLTITDQLNNRLTFEKPPQRIISLVPSITEYLYDLGLQERIIAQTQFCIHPKQAFATATKIGGTKKLNLEKIKNLAPDFIIANKEENVKEQIEHLQTFAPVYISDIDTTEQALQMMRDVAHITQKQELVEDIVGNILYQLTRLNGIFKGTFVYLIWQNPLYAVGQNNYINNVLQHLGLTNKITSNRYPLLSQEELTALNPDYLFLSTEPFPFKAKHIDYFQQIMKQTQVKIISGEMCSWYGSRMLQLETYFTSYFQPQ